MAGDQVKLEGAEFDFEAGTVDLAVKAILTMNIYIESLRTNDGSTILVTNSHEDETGAEVLTGVDGVTGAPLEITIRSL